MTREDAERVAEMLEELASGGMVLTEFLTEHDDAILHEAADLIRAAAKEA